MCDSFDMACRDASNALQLNIKVNSENLLPSAQKYNVGSLRLPADPSWPKIPQRRLIDDLDDRIEPPCVVTLTGTPRKSRTTVRSSNSHQSSRPNLTKDQVPASHHQHIYQKIPSLSPHPLKRRPGCADPRFKKVTTVKSQMTSTDLPNREHDNPTELSHSAVIIANQTQCTIENVRKTVPEKDTDPSKVTQQEAEKPGEIRGMDSIGVQTITSEDSTIGSPKKNLDDIEIAKELEGSKKCLDNAVEMKNRQLSAEEIGKEEQTVISEQKPPNVGKSCDKPDQVSTMRNGNEQETQREMNFSKDENSSSSVTIVPSNPANVSQSESASLKYCQGNGGQFFLVVENKAQSSSLGTIQINTNPVPSCQYTTQCYNVQVPVLSYQNLPLQISTQQTQKIDIPSQLSLSPVLTIPSTPSIKNNHQLETSNGKFSHFSKVSESLTNETIANVENFIKSNILAESCEKAVATLKDTKDNSEIGKTHEGYNKDHISSDFETQRTRKMLATPPVKLERKHETGIQYDTVKINSDGISESFKASRVQQLLSDTTDSEIYGIEMRQLKTSHARQCSKETSGSGSDYDVNFERQFRSNEIGQTRKKRRNPTYCSNLTSQEVVCARNYNNNCIHERDSLMDEKESSMTRQDAKSRTYRKMKSEQNLSRNLPLFCGKNYKNISDPHITARETYAQREGWLCTSGYSSANRRKNDNQPREVKTPKETCLNRENNDVTTDEIDSDIPNLPDSCDTHRTDVSNIEESKNPVTLTTNETTSLPVKTQQLLNKSYMEYYDKLRSNNVVDTFQQRYVCQMAMGAPQLKKRKPELSLEVTRIGEEDNQSKTEALTMEKLSALSNIINRNLNPALRNSNDTVQTKQIYVNENMKTSSDPTAVTRSAVLTRKIATGNSADLYDSSAPSSTRLVNKVRRKREKPVERRLLKLKTIAFFGFMMYATIVLLPMMYTYFFYDEYEDYEDLSYIELMLEYVVSSFREAFGGLFDAVNEIFFRPVSLD